MPYVEYVLNSKTEGGHDQNGDRNAIPDQGIAVHQQNTHILHNREPDLSAAVPIVPYK